MEAQDDPKTGHTFRDNAIAFLLILIFVVVLVYLGITGH
jgi:hypothetical protein